MIDSLRNKSYYILGDFSFVEAAENLIRVRYLIHRFH